jgi:uncharacterized PurR-regulated membrane protein YhhQ (DUF165 family)
MSESQLKLSDKFDGNNFHSMINPKKPKLFKGYPFFIAFIAAMQIICTVYSRRFVDFFGLDIGLGTLAFPLVLYAFQIVAEVYGWEYSRQAIWCNFFVNAVMTVFTFIGKFIHYSSFNHPSLAMAYTTLMDTVWISSAAWWFGVFFSDWLTVLFMCNSRSKFNGRFLVIRILLLHCFAEVVLLSGSLITLPYNGYSMQETYHVVTTAFIARTIISILLLPFARYVIYLVETKLEGVVTFDYHNKHSLFQMGVDDKRMVQFDAKDWSRLSEEKKKRMDINKIDLSYYDDDKLGIDKIFKNKK